MSKLSDFTGPDITILIW